MTGRLRYLLALAFVALFCLFPAADGGEIAVLKTSSWLKSDTGPLATKVAVFEGERVPVPTRMLVDLRESGSGGRPDPRRVERYSRALREWARASDHPTDPELPPLLLVVYVGETGFRSTLMQRRAGQPHPVGRLEVSYGSKPDLDSRYHPDRWSLLPAFLAIVLAILSGRVIPSLLIGCLAGSMLATGGPLTGLSHFAVDTVAGHVLTRQFHLEITGFVLFLFMTVAVMSRAGGIQGMVDRIQRYARGPVSTQVCSFVVGVLIFFDDYTNCVVTGSTMRPLADRNRVSREKLAYIVDSTAAPIAGLSLFSTWIAYEVSMFAPQLPEVTKTDGSQYAQSDGFAVLIETLPFRFYCILTLVMVVATIVLRREFGPMLAAARRAARDGKPLADDARPMVAAGLTDAEPRAGAPLRARNAAIPLAVLVTLTIGLILWFGTSAVSASEASLPAWQVITTILGNGQPQRALFLASLVAFVVAIALAVGQRILTLAEALHSAVRSTRALVVALTILILAWAIGRICEPDNLGTAQFLAAATRDVVTPWLVPIATFAISALVAFSTGTSYGTMAILLPNVVVLAHTAGETDPTLGGPLLMVLTIGAVLEGSIFGDHCSPISDTTVLSSVSTASDHLHHVRTQAPYALTVMAISAIACYAPVGLLGASAWPVSMGAGIAAVIGVLFLAGRNPNVAPG